MVQEILVLYAMPAEIRLNKWVNLTAKSGVSLSFWQQVILFALFPDQGVQHETRDHQL